MQHRLIALAATLLCTLGSTASHAEDVIQTRLMGLELANEVARDAANIMNAYTAPWTRTYPRLTASLRP